MAAEAHPDTKLDPARLLAGLTRLRANLEDDLRERRRERPDLEAALREEHRLWPSSASAPPPPGTPGATNA